jgi:hypothetical protein
MSGMVKTFSDAIAYTAGPPGRWNFFVVWRGLKPPGTWSLNMYYFNF